MSKENLKKGKEGKGEGIYIERKGESVMVQKVMGRVLMNKDIEEKLIEEERIIGE